MHVLGLRQSLCRRSLAFKKFLKRKMEMLHYKLDENGNYK